MLKGREINEVKFSKLRECILGSDFNSKRKLKALSKINSPHYVKQYFDLCTEIVNNKKNILSYDLTHSLGNFLHDIEITEQINTNRKIAKQGDFVISRMRSYLKEFAVVQSNNNEQLFSTEYLIYRPKTHKISSNTLLVFCLTKEVQTILDCSQYGSEHPRFYEFVFNELPLPKVLFKINKTINSLFNEMYQLRNKSHSLYRQAEELLLENTGLKNFRPSQENKNIKTLKESLLKTARLDAEYYQPKYENYIRLSENYSEGFEPLQKVCKLKDENFIPKDEEKYKYIELSNVDKFGNITSYHTDDGINLPSRARRKVNTNDIIISSVEGSLDSCALITKDYDNAICSTGFYVINSSKINSQTLLILFKSELMQNILKQNCSGTILTAINKNEFQNIPVPLINYKIQTEIADLINKSFALRRESERLLEQAEKSAEKILKLKTYTKKQRRRHLF